MRYESLVQNPEAEFPAICEFVGVRFHPNMLADVRRSSIRRDPPPDLPDGIRDACDALWQTLCADEGRP